MGEGRGEGGHGAGGEAGHGGGGGDCRGQEARADVAVLRTNQIVSTGSRDLVTANHSSPARPRRPRTAERTPPCPPRPRRGRAAADAWPQDTLISRFDVVIGGKQN